MAKTKTSAQRANIEKRQQLTEAKSNTQQFLQIARLTACDPIFKAAKAAKGLSNTEKLSNKQLKAILFAEGDNVQNYTPHILQDGERVPFRLTTNAEKATTFHTNIAADENGGTDTAENAISALKNVATALQFDMQKSLYFVEVETEIIDYVEKKNGKVVKETRKSHIENVKKYAYKVQSNTFSECWDAFAKWLGVSALFAAEEAELHKKELEIALQTLKEAEAAAENAANAANLKAADLQKAADKKREKVEKARAKVEELQGFAEEKK